MRVDDLLLTLRVVIFWVRVFCQVYFFLCRGSDSIAFEQLDVDKEKVLSKTRLV